MKDSLIKRFIALLSAFALTTFLTACVSSAVTPMGRDTFAVTAIVDAECGLQKANEIAFKQIAAATIKNGYDAFEIAQIQSSQSSSVVGTTPIYVTGNTYGGFNAFGGQPIVSSQFNQNFVVKMFRSSDPEAAKVIDARAVLGPDWAKVVSQTKLTCF
jgi:hypothetical protein